MIRPRGHIVLDRAAVESLGLNAAALLQWISERDGEPVTFESIARDLPWAGERTWRRTAEELVAEGLVTAERTDRGNTYRVDNLSEASDRMSDPSCCEAVGTLPALKSKSKTNSINNKHIAASPPRAESQSPSQPSRAEERRSAAKRIVALYATEVKSRRFDAYPTATRRHIENLLARGHSEDDLAAAVRRYASWCRADNRQEQYRVNGRNFFGRERLFESYGEDGEVVNVVPQSSWQGLQEVSGG